MVLPDHTCLQLNIRRWHSTCRTVLHGALVLAGQTPYACTAAQQAEVATARELPYVQRIKAVRLLQAVLGM